jgi:hypothetical protein
MYEQVREELASNGCQIKIGCEVKSVSKFNGGTYICSKPKLIRLATHEYLKNKFMIAHIFSLTSLPHLKMVGVLISDH